jgi:hypothetical protein
MAAAAKPLARGVAGKRQGIRNRRIAAILRKTASYSRKLFDRDAQERRMGACAVDRCLSRTGSHCRLHATLLADFGELRNQFRSQAFYIEMNFERPTPARTEDTMKRLVAWSDLPPAQAGLSAALRRAYATPQDDRTREFEELLRKLC